MLGKFTRTVSITSLLAIGLWAIPANAANDNIAEGGYFGMSFVQGTIGYSGGEADSNVIDFRFGNMLNEHVGIEGRFGLGVSEGEVSSCVSTYGGYYCANANLGIDTYYGAYLRTYLTDPGGFRPYLLLGYSRGKVSASAGSSSASASEGDFSFGFGFDIGSETGALTLEYANLFDKDGTEITGISIGFLTRF